MNLPRDPKADNDELAHRMATGREVDSGPVSAIGTLAPSPAGLVEGPGPGSCGPRAGPLSHMSPTPVPV